MSYQITEVQNKNVTRVYNLDGPKIQTIKAFWDHLVSAKIIESYEITKS
jgi:hypothetical protein